MYINPTNASAREQRILEYAMSGTEVPEAGMIAEYYVLAVRQAGAFGMISVVRFVRKPNVE
jgi:hypothetical protein